MTTETGETTAGINARGDADAWPRVLAALQSGATLFRPAGLTRYFTQCSDDRDPNDGIGIQASLVKRLEARGVLIRAGVDRYALGKVAEPVPPPQLALF